MLISIASNPLDTYSCIPNERLLFILCDHDFLVDWAADAVMIKGVLSMVASSVDSESYTNIDYLAYKDISITFCELK